LSETFIFRLTKIKSMKDYRVVTFNAQVNTEQGGYIKTTSEIKKGYFHRWFYDADDTGEGKALRALIEDEEGKVHALHYSKVIFTPDEDNPKKVKERKEAEELTKKLFDRPL